MHWRILRGDWRIRTKRNQVAAELVELAGHARFSETRTPIPTLRPLSLRGRREFLVGFLARADAGRTPGRCEHTRGVLLLRGQPTDRPTSAVNLWGYSGITEYENGQELAPWGTAWRVLTWQRERQYERGGGLGDKTAAKSLSGSGGAGALSRRGDRPCSAKARRATGSRTKRDSGCP